MHIKNNYGKVAVIMGGFSEEREVSLISGGMVLKSLLKSGIDAVAFDPKDTPIWQLQDLGVDRAFLVTHGMKGEDGLLQGSLEYLQIPYTNSGVMASAIAMNKYRTKLIWQALAIPIAKSQYLQKHGFDFSKFNLAIDLPVVVKTVNGGSTLALTKVYTYDQLESAIALAFLHDHSILIEELIIGDEYTITICDGVVYPIIKIEAENGEYDYQNKYFTDTTKYICPVDLGSLQQTIEDFARRGYEGVGARGVARIDLMLDSQKQIYFLEINTLPGMTSHSLVPMSFLAANIDFDQLCLQILSGARLGD